MTHQEDILKRWDVISKSGCPDLKLQISTVGEIDLFNKEGDWNKGAVFSDCRKYRYVLWRIWNKNKPFIMFIGLNPSTANETKDDPTIRRVQKFAFDWGYGGVIMMNLFVYVTSQPEELEKCKGPWWLNNEWLTNIAVICERIIFAWGSFQQAKERAEEVKKMFDGYALAINKDGSPRHPLYVKKNIEPVSIN